MAAATAVYNDPEMGTTTHRSIRQSGRSRAVPPREALLVTHATFIMGTTLTLLLGLCLGLLLGTRLGQALSLIHS